MQESGGVAVGPRRPGAVTIAVAGATLLLDQVTKALVRAELPVGEVVPVVPGVLDFIHVRNLGAAFGLFPGRQPVFIVMSLAVLLVIALFWRAFVHTWLVTVSVGLVTGGAIGNLLDRVFLGRVTDFFAAAFIDFPVFNVADVAIVAGVGLLVFWLLFSREHGQVRSPVGDDDALEPECAPPEHGGGKQ